jgi:hypothetical protein
MRILDLFRRKREPETGAENARRFVTIVARLAAESRIVEMYPYPGRSNRNEHFGWQWMANSAWRKEVNRLLHAQRVPVKDARFHSPDSLDGWSFSCVSTVPLPRVATLTLEDTL